MRLRSPTHCRSPSALSSSSKFSELFIFQLPEKLGMAGPGSLTVCWAWMAPEAAPPSLPGRSLLSRLRQAFSPRSRSDVSFYGSAALSSPSPVLLGEEESSSPHSPGGPPLLPLVSLGDLPKGFGSLQCRGIMRPPISVAGGTAPSCAIPCLGPPHNSPTPFSPIPDRVQLNGFYLPHSKLHWGTGILA